VTRVGRARAGGRGEALGFLVVALRERKWARRALSALSVVFLLVGVGLLALPILTNLYQGRVQARLDRQLASPELRQAYRERRVATGDSLTRLKIPAISVDVVVVEGISPKALRAGAGHYPATPLPCESGNVAIAGHRTTYGKPFANLDRLKVGDVITLETPIGSCTYELRRTPFITMPTDLSVVAPRPDRTLTLTTCHPRGSAAKRLIVQAQLVREEPLATLAA
jgi:sortase A